LTRHVGKNLTVSFKSKNGQWQDIEGGVRSINLTIGLSSVAPPTADVIDFWRLSHLAGRNAVDLAEGHLGVVEAERILENG